MGVELRADPPPPPGQPPRRGEQPDARGEVPASDSLARRRVSRRGVGRSAGGGRADACRQGRDRPRRVPGRVRGPRRRRRRAGARQDVDARDRTPSRKRSGEGDGGRRDPHRPRRRRRAETGPFGRQPVAQRQRERAGDADRHAVRQPRQQLQRRQPLPPSQLRSAQPRVQDPQQHDRGRVLDLGLERRVLPAEASSLLAALGPRVGLLGRQQQRVEQRVELRRVEQ